MGKDFCLECLTPICCGRHVNLPGEWCSTYSCNYTRNFQPGDAWKRHYWSQKTNPTGHPGAGESLIQADSWADADSSPCSENQCGLETVPCKPPPPGHETGCETQGNNNRARQKWRTPISKPKEDKLMHWTQQHQKSQEAKYRYYQTEYDRNFGSGRNSNISIAAVSQSHSQPVCQAPPPRDIMEPRPNSNQDCCWKGVPIPSDDPMYEPIYPSDVDGSQFQGSKNPFQYFNRSRKFPWRNNRSDARPVTQCDILTPDQLGTFGSVMDSRLSRRHVAKQRVSERYLASM